MVGWNDLPTELKKKVVQMLFDESMESEDDYRSFEAFQTLKALNAVDRELHVLSAPLRWQFLDAAQCSLSLIHSFADKVGVSKGQFIRNVKLWQPETAARELLAVVEAYVKLLSTLTGLAYLEIRCRPSVALGVLPLLPPTLPRTLRCLKLRGWSEKNFITSDLAAAIIYAFPEVVELEFFDICQGSTEGAALAVKALRSLHKLQELSLGDGDGFTHASLALPWNSSLVGLNLLDMVDELPLPFLQGLLERHCTTLKQLGIPTYDAEAHFPHCPNLQYLTLRVETLTISASQPLLPLTSSTSPLEGLQVAMSPKFDATVVDAVLEVVLLHQGTLRWVKMKTYKAGGEDEEALERVKGACERFGVSYSFEVEPFEENEEDEEGEDAE